MPAVQRANAPSETPIFVLGIVSIVLSTQGVLGLILSLITRSKIINHEKEYGELVGKGKIGKTLATIALPVSIVFTVGWVIGSISTMITSCNTLTRVTNWLINFSEGIS